MPNSHSGGFGKPLGPRPGAAKRAAKLNTSGLGRSLVNRKATTSAGSGMSDRHTTDIILGESQPSWVKLQSKTSERPLEEFLSNAELAETDFTTERTANIRILQSGGQTIENPFVLSDKQREVLVQKHYNNAGRLTVPRRSKWSRDMSAKELDKLEKEAFLEWRRSLADLQENQDLLLTPFERNIEVWRQLWRVVERSDLVVQIVDARNPLQFRSVDLDKYVQELGGNKTSLLLVNKADMLSLPQRKAWAEYFSQEGIDFTFFSARTSLEQQLEKSDKQFEGKDESEDENFIKAEVGSKDAGVKAEQTKVEINTTAVLNVDQLEALFRTSAPELPEDRSQLQIGLVGYPNVGKSSTINALLGAKRVSVSATPGKTKHFQTIPLCEDVMLCDCPGLVFPNFAQTNGDLVCNGVLPIDQLREYTGPVELVCQRIPRFFLEATYGIVIPVRPADEGGNGVPTAEELLSAYALARGFTRANHGGPDTSRASRAVLKDYVTGRLLFCEPPPTWDATTQGDFNAGKFNVMALPERRRDQILSAVSQARGAKAAEELEAGILDLADEMKTLKFSSFNTTEEAPNLRKPTKVQRSQHSSEPIAAGIELDREFFGNGPDRGTAQLPFHLQKMQGPSKKHYKGKGKKK